MREENGRLPTAFLLQPSSLQSLRRRWCADDGRVQNSNAWEAGKVGEVEGQEFGQAVNKHGSNKPCVMAVLAENAVRDNQAPPFRKDGWGIGKQGKESLEAGQLGICFGCG
jgi:hypothetical protein